MPNVITNQLSNHCHHKSLLYTVLHFAQKQLCAMAIASKMRSMEYISYAYRNGNCTSVNTIRKQRNSDMKSESEMNAGRAYSQMTSSHHIMAVAAGCSHKSSVKLGDFDMDIQAKMNQQTNIIKTAVCIWQCGFYECMEASFFDVLTIRCSSASIPLSSSLSLCLFFFYFRYVCREKERQSFCCHQHFNFMKLFFRRQSGSNGPSKSERNTLKSNI